MTRSVRLLLACIPLAVPWRCADSLGADPRSGPQGVLTRVDKVTPQFLDDWKLRGATAIVVPLDERSKGQWQSLARMVEQAGMTLWPWVEVARNESMADAHPDWMASIGAHHHDWKRRFPEAPAARPGTVIKVWPWVPLAYQPAFEAHRDRLKNLLIDLPGAWSGVFVNDLQAGPSSCGCGNDQCRWAIDYGAAPTAPRLPGDDLAAILISELSERHAGKSVIPVWVTECEPGDLPDAMPSTGFCGGVGCARGDCWPRYVRQWNPLVKAATGPIAVAVWARTFHRDAAQWIDTDITLFQNPPKGGAPLAASRTVAVIQAWDTPPAEINALAEKFKQSSMGFIIVLDPIDQSWQPRLVTAPSNPPGDPAKKSQRN